MLLRVDDVPRRAAPPRRSRTAGSSRGSSRPPSASTELLDDFDFSHAALDLYAVFWSEVCDWYLELVKPRLYADDDARRVGHAAVRARAHARAAAPGHALRDRGDLVAHARRARAARCRRRGPRPPRRFDPEAERGGRRGGRGRHRAAPLPRRGRASRPRRACPRASRPSGYERRPAHVARLARLSGSPTATARTAPRRHRAGRHRPGAGRRRRRLRGGRAPARERGARSSRARSRAPRPSSPTTASSSRRRPRSWQAEREKLARLRRELDELRVTFARGRGVPARPRAVRHALRPRPHAPADDRARHAAAAVRLDPRGRHERQVLDRADDRGDPRAPRRSHRLLHLASPARRSRERVEVGERPVGEPDVRRRRRARARAPPARGPERRRTTTRHPVRGAHRGRLPRARARGRGGRGGRGRARRPLRRDERDPLARPGAHRASGSSTRAGWARRSRTSPRRSSPSCATTATLVCAPPSPEAEEVARRIAAERSAQLVRVDPAAEAPGRCGPAGASSGPTSPSPGPPPRPSSARLDARARARGRGRGGGSRAPAGGGPTTRSRSSTAPTTPPGRGPSQTRSPSC